MWLIPGIVVLAILTGYVAGGRLSGFEGLSVHWWLLVFVGLGLQLVPLPETDLLTPRLLGTIVLMASYVCLLAFIAINRWIPAARVMALGLLLNLLVVGVNEGMPVSPAAIETAGGRVSELAYQDSAKHHLLDDRDILGFLGDVIPLPNPVGIVLSIGDVLLYAGVAWFVIEVMRGRSRETPAPSRCGSCRTAGSTRRDIGGWRPATGLLITLQQGDREAYRDRGAFAGGALDLEGSSTDLGSFAHHRHPEVTLGSGRVGIETHPVVRELQDDVVAGPAHADAEVARLRVLQGVHHPRGDEVTAVRRRQRDVLHVVVEHDAGLPPDLVGERLERLGETLGPQRGTVEIVDQGPNPVRGLLLGARIFSSCASSSWRSLLSSSLRATSTCSERRNRT